MRVEKAGADLLHVDVMDGRFVPRITFGIDAVKLLKKTTKLPLDVHLMVAEPWKLVKAYSNAGAKRICVHVEAGEAKKILETIKLIKKSRCKAGVAIKPRTNLETIDSKILKAADFIMPMTVEPGAAGQQFMPDQLPKIELLNSRLKKLKLKKELEADGGINPQTARLVVERGVTVLVAGGAIYGAQDAREAVRRLKQA